jgi:hypothetical protein
MKVGGSKRVLTDHPTRRENDKIGQSDAWHRCFHSQDGENRGIRMVKTDRVDGIKATEVVLERRVIAMPSNHIKR